MRKPIELTRSETWLNDDFDMINKILEDTTEEFIGDVKIINIQVVEEKSGLKRFWIYSEVN